MSSQTRSKLAFGVELALVVAIAGTIFVPAIGADVRNGSKLAFLGLTAFCFLLAFGINHQNRTEDGSAAYGTGLVAFLAGPAAVLFFLAERAAGTQLETWVVFPFLVIGALGAVAMIARAGRQSQNARTVWTVTALVMVWLVAYFSGTTGSPGNLPIFGKGILDWPTVVIVTRKTVHIVFYGCFALVLREVLNLKEISRNALVSLLGLTFGLACIDEFRQAAFPDRSGSWMDVLLDTGAAAVFLQIAARRMKKSHQDAKIQNP